MDVSQVQDIDQLLDWWWEHKYSQNDFESKEQYEKRRELAIPILIGEKQRRINAGEEIF